MFVVQFFKTIKSFIINFIFICLTNEVNLSDASADAEEAESDNIAKELSKERKRQ